MKNALILVSLVACTADEVTTETQATPTAELRELDAKAKAVFVGEVVSIEYRVSEPDANGNVTPFHFVTWRVDQAARGVDAGTTWTGRFAGGPFGDGRELHVSEVPDFAIGQRALVFANDGDVGSCALASCREGLILVGDRDPATVDRLVLAFTRSTDVRVRSADWKARFNFEMPTAGRTGRTR
jgi:hypothetical protein